MKRWVFLFLVCFFSNLSFGFAASIRLQNDSNINLRAIVKGADGSFLGDILVTPQSKVTWTDSYHPFEKGENPAQGPIRSQTPLMVLWYSQDGTHYSMSDHVSTGALVKASQGVGDKNCARQPPQKAIQDKPKIGE